jgi:hypothetical protein
MRRFYLITRDLHLYAGLFLSPFVLVFSVSVFYLAHGFAQRPAPDQAFSSRTVSNSPLMRWWRVLADATAYLTLFITVSGIYLWVALKAERRVGLMLVLAGAITFVGLVYAIAA